MTVIWTPKDDPQLRGVPPKPEPASIYDREVLRERFARVIMLAGYRGEAIFRILDDYFDEFMKGENGDLSGFVTMLEEYERTKGDPD